MFPKNYVVVQLSSPCVPHFIPQGMNYKDSLVHSRFRKADRSMLITVLCKLYVHCAVTVTCLSTGTVSHDHSHSALTVTCLSAGADSHEHSYCAAIVICLYVVDVHHDHSHCAAIVMCHSAGTVSHDHSHCAAIVMYPSVSDVCAITTLIAQLL
jgi:hypothetical protein